MCLTFPIVCMVSLHGWRASTSDGNTVSHNPSRTACCALLYLDRANVSTSDLNLV